MNKVSRYFLGLLYFIQTILSFKFTGFKVRSMWCECTMVHGIFSQNAELMFLFLSVTQAENDLNELKALMHSPNAIVVRPADPATCTLNAES